MYIAFKMRKVIIKFKCNKTTRIIIFKTSVLDLLFLFLRENIF